MPQGRFEYKQLVKYPHLKPADELTWGFFLTKYPQAYESVDYDLALGEMPEHAAEAEKLGIAGAEKLFMYKADVIGYRIERIDIIEIKQKATPSAIGQILLYKKIYDEEQKPTIPTRAVIVARDTTPQVTEMCLEYNITLIIV